MPTHATHLLQKKKSYHPNNHFINELKNDL